MKHVAVLGAGRIGRIHAHNVSSLPGVKLRAICDPMAESANALAHDLGVDAIPLDVALNDPTIDVVLIASPTATHSDLLLRAAAAGKQIFCEKPVDLSVPRAEECVRAIQDAGVACMVGFQRRFDPTFHAVHQGLVNGKIGSPEMLVITSRDPGAPPAGYLQQSGGIFRDMLIHDFDMFRWLLCGNDEATWLVATGSCLTDSAIAQVGDIDSAMVTIRTRAGRLCQINASRRAAYGYDQRLELLGSSGLLMAGNHRPLEVVKMDASGTHYTNPEHFFLERYREAYRLEVCHFFEQLQSGSSFRTTVQDGVAAQKLADAAARSFESGKPVRLDVA